MGLEVKQECCNPKASEDNISKKKEESLVSNDSENQIRIRKRTDHEFARERHQRP